MNKTSSILIIEDEVITAMSLIMDLKKYGYKNVKFVQNGTKALTSSRESIPDLIIADVSLSGGESGIDVAVKIRGETAIPVILTSGYEVDDISDKLNGQEKFYFVQKPVLVSKLISLIESL